MTVRSRRPRIVRYWALVRISRCGAGDADEAEPALLFQLVQVAAGAAVREDAFLQADHRDDGELQPLGGVQRHQRDRAAGALHVVGVADEADVGEVVVERRPRGCRGRTRRRC